MGRRLNLTLPVAFVLFVLTLFYTTFGTDAPVANDDNDVGTADHRRPPAMAGAETTGHTAVPAPAAGAVAVTHPVASAPATYDDRIGVLMMACNRPDVRRALDRLFR